MQALRQGERRYQRYTLADCQLDENAAGPLIRIQGKILVPDQDELRARVLRSIHETPAYGHPGRNKFYALLQREYIWP